MDETKRMTVQKMQDLVNMTGLELGTGTYVSAALCQACHIGLMSAAEFGIKNSEEDVFARGSSVLGNGFNLEPHEMVARAYGLPLAYIVGLEVGFEGWNVDLVNEVIDTDSEEFKMGHQDGRNTRAAVAMGQITPPPVKQEEVTVEDVEDLTFGRDGVRTDDPRYVEHSPLAVHGSAIAEGSAWRS